MEKIPRSEVHYVMLQEPLKHWPCHWPGFRANSNKPMQRFPEEPGEITDLASLAHSVIHRAGAITAC